MNSHQRRIAKRKAKRTKARKPIGWQAIFAGQYIMRGRMVYIGRDGKAYPA